jgi:uncharacterized protein YkwD
VPGGPTFRRISLLRLLLVILGVTLVPLAARGAVDISTDGRNIAVTGAAEPVGALPSPPQEALPATPNALGGSSSPEATTTSTSSTSSTTTTTARDASTTTTTTTAPPETTATTAAPPSTAPGESQPEYYETLLASVSADEADQLVRVIERVNQARDAAGCSPLNVDARLTAAAQGHSDDMSARRYMDHTNPDGETPSDRAAAEGYVGAVGENIAQGYTSADAVMDAWMASQGHRANIENCTYTIIGVGLATDGWYWTQVFGQA